MTLQSEQDYLKLIDKHFPSKLDTNVDSVQLGRGDDCAIAVINGCACISTDLFLDTVHFRQDYFTPANIGHKALAVNISDIAAMGGVPRFFTLDLMIPKGLGFDFWDQFFAGMSTLASEHNLTLIGGDLSRSPTLGTSIHIWGEPGPSGTLLTRGNTRPGDLLVVIGQLGLARVGLQVLEAQGLKAITNYPESTAQHLRPSPFVSAGLILAANPQVRGLMDLSDGLARDLPRFLAASEGTGAQLVIEPTMLHKEVLCFAKEQDISPVHVAMLGGEDYGLLTAIAPDALRTILRDIPLAQVVGVVTAEPDILLNDAPFDCNGFDHFGG